MIIHKSAYTKALLCLFLFIMPCQVYAANKSPEAKQPITLRDLSTERSGDDLVLRVGNGRTVISNFFAPGASEGAALFDINLPQEGRCTLSINDKAEIIDAKCTK